MNEEKHKKLPVAAIVGRPNVGKSSLFNAIIGSRLSIVHEMSGVTRDRVIAPASHRGRDFELVDTGGLGMRFGETRNLDVWDERIAGQVESALQDADVLIFVTNVQAGLLPLDEEVAQKLRSCNLPVIVAANKADNPELAKSALEMTAMGFGDVSPVSCLHRAGLGDLLDRVVAALPAPDQNEVAAADEEDAAADEENKKDENSPVKIAVIGRPNVGKSSLVNALLGEERVMVSEIAGTTRDAIDSDFQIKYRDGIRPAVLIDTAGLRKKGKVHDAVEMFSVMRAQSAISRADLIVFVTEASIDGVTAQDRRIAGMIEESGKACVIAVNKIDLCADQPAKELVKQIRFSLPNMNYAPLVTLSAAKHRNLNQLLDQIAQVMEQLQVRIPTSVVNQVLADAFERTTPPVIGNAPLKFYYASQVGTAPPRFLLFVNDKKYCADHYVGYLMNALRQAFDFTGLPIVLELRSRPKKVASVHTPARTPGGKRPAKTGRNPGTAGRKPGKPAGRKAAGPSAAKRRTTSGRGKSGGKR
ncbi:MAG: ribosome biogenesis GTPase Der [Victivallaceae bacterium]|nr:ribosome biogenesis GTPase Der [Victivallaceae bacterium]